jgi:hypothetical protein
MMANKNDLDVAFVGGGFRAVTFLAANPGLLRYRVGLIESSSVIGPGSFADLTCNSSSNGAGFFRHVPRDGEFGWIFDDPVIGPIANAQCPVPLPDLAQALRRLGDALQERLDPMHIHLRRRVTAIDINADCAHLQLSDHAPVRTRVAILASGREECPHPVLLPWREKTWLSHQVLDRTYRSSLVDSVRSAGGRPMVIAGNSHSAFAAAEALLSIVTALGAQGCECHSPIIIVGRRPVRLYYDSLAQAENDQAHYSGLPVDGKSHVCPETGAVFRDSGLRHSARRLYCALSEGKLARMAFRHVTHPRDYYSEFNDASFIVQALGYHGRAPTLRSDDGWIRPSDDTTPLKVTAEGMLAHANPRVSYRVGVIRVDPTPPMLRDCGAYASRLYEQLGQKIASVLEVRPSG